MSHVFSIMIPLHHITSYCHPIITKMATRNMNAASQLLMVTWHCQYFMAERFVCTQVSSVLQMAAVSRQLAVHTCAVDSLFWLMLIKEIDYSTTLDQSESLEHWLVIRHLQQISDIKGTRAGTAGNWPPAGHTLLHILNSVVNKIWSHATSHLWGMGSILWISGSIVVDAFKRSTSTELLSAPLPDSRVTSSSDVESSSSDEKLSTEASLVSSDVRGTLSLLLVAAMYLVLLQKNNWLDDMLFCSQQEIRVNMIIESGKIQKPAQFVKSYLFSIMQ